MAGAQSLVSTPVTQDGAEQVTQLSPPALFIDSLFNQLECMTLLQGGVRSDDPIIPDEAAILTTSYNSNRLNILPEGINPYMHRPHQPILSDVPYSPGLSFYVDSIFYTLNMGEPQLSTLAIRGATGLNVPKKE